MQIQIDPGIPANIPNDEIRDYKAFLDTALESLTTAAGGDILTLGNAMFAGLALIVVVWAGVKIAFSGNLHPWDVVKLVIGLWIPWVMLQFYTVNIPGMGSTFPGMIAGGGNFLHELLIGDTVGSMQIELTEMVKAIAGNIQAQAAAGNLMGVITGGAHAFITAVAGYDHARLDDSHAGGPGRGHLCPGDLGADRHGDPHYLGSDVHSLSSL